MNEEYCNTEKISKLLAVARDIEKNPSQLHCGCKHKDAPQTPEFDWNIFVNRIDKMIEEDRTVNSPFRRCQLVLSLLNADLTYDNRSRAKKLLHKILETLEQQEREARKRDREDREQIEQDKKELLTSTYLTDEFWQNVVKPAKENSQTRVRVLDKEEYRYAQLPLFSN